MATKEFIDIRIKLKGELKERFSQIKSRSGLSKNTEVVRLLINDAHRRILRTGSL